MLNVGIESRPEFQVADDVLAFGLSAGLAAGDSPTSVLNDEAFNQIAKAARKSQAEFVVLDIRNLSKVHSADVDRFMALERALQPLRSKLVLLTADPLSHKFILAVRRGRFFVVNSEAELLNLVRKEEECGTTSIGFTREELEQLNRDGITLDDAIRAVEGIRDR